MDLVKGLLDCFCLLVCLFVLDSDIQLHVPMTGKSIDQFVKIKETDNDIYVDLELQSKPRQEEGLREERKEEGDCSIQRKEKKEGWRRLCA